MIANLLTVLLHLMDILWVCIVVFTALGVGSLLGAVAAILVKTFLNRRSTWVK